MQQKLTLPLNWAEVATAAANTTRIYKKMKI
jgi:hypothetical protein